MKNIEVHILRNKECAVCGVVINNWILTKAILKNLDIIINVTYEEKEERLENAPVIHYLIDGRQIGESIGAPGSEIPEIFQLGMIRVFLAAIYEIMEKEKIKEEKLPVLFKLLGSFDKTASEHTSKPCPGCPEEEK